MHSATTRSRLKVYGRAAMSGAIPAREAGVQPCDEVIDAAEEQQTSSLIWRTCADTL